MSALTNSNGEALRKCNHCKCTTLLNVTFYSKNKRGEFWKTCEKCRTKYTCTADGCDKSFGSKSNLNAHIRTVHQNYKPFSCDECDKSFGRKSSLDIHIRTVHQSDKPFTCDECDKSFGQKGNLDTHTKICTGNLQISGGELACRKAFELLDIKYESEASDVKNDADNWLRFDFKIQPHGYPMYVEFDGKQHTKPMRFGGVSLDQAIQNLIKLREHDKIKNEYCEKNNIPLLRIPYTRIDDVMDMIRDFTEIEVNQD